jgi:hypothetical protein
MWPPQMPPPLSAIRVSNARASADFAGLSINTNSAKDELTRIAVDGFDLDVELHDWKSFTVDLNSNKTFITDSTSSYLEGGTVKIRGEMRGDKFRARKIDIQSPRLSMQGSSEIRVETKKKSNIIEKISVALDASNIDADLSVVGSFLDIPGNRGRVDGRAGFTLGIPLDERSPAQFEARGRIKSHDARFYDFRLYDTESDFKVDLDSFELMNTRIMLGEEVVAKGGGTIAFDKAVTFKFNLSPDKLPFSNLLGIFNVDTDVVDFNLTSPQLSISGTGDPFNMHVS